MAHPILTSLGNALRSLTKGLKDCWHYQKPCITYNTHAYKSNPGWLVHSLQLKMVHLYVPPSKQMAVRENIIDQITYRLPFYHHLKMIRIFVWSLSFEMALIFTTALVCIALCIPFPSIIMCFFSLVALCIACIAAIVAAIDYFKNFKITKGNLELVTANSAEILYPVENSNRTTSKTLWQAIDLKRFLNPFALIALLCSVLYYLLLSIVDAISTTPWNPLKEEKSNWMAYVIKQFIALLFTPLLYLFYVLSDGFVAFLSRCSDACIELFHTSPTPAQSSDLQIDISVQPTEIPTLAKIEDEKCTPQTNQNSMTQTPSKLSIVRNSSTLPSGTLTLHQHHSSRYSVSHSLAKMGFIPGISSKRPTQKYHNSYIPKHSPAIQHNFSTPHVECSYNQSTFPDTAPFSQRDASKDNKAKAEIELVLR